MPKESKLLYLRKALRTLMRLVKDGLVTHKQAEDMLRAAVTKALGRDRHPS